MKLKLFYISLLFFLLSPATFATQATDQTDLVITQLLNSVKNLSSEQRIYYISHSLLNRPYQLEPLGEGPTGTYNKEPLYRLDRFDCETYVNTVLSLALANDLKQFKNNIRKINYFDGEVSFIKRFHFTDAEWVPNNIKNGFVKEITQDVAGPNDTALEQTYLNRQNWYQHLPQNRIKIPGLTSAQQKTKLIQLRAEGTKMQNTTASIVYIPLTKLLIHGKPNFSIFNKIPNSAIILFVHNDPDLAKSIGTDVNISHMGFVIWKNNRPYLCAASSLENKTLDLPLIEYLRYYLNKPTMKGIALFQAIS